MQNRQFKISVVSFISISIYIISFICYVALFDTKINEDSQQGYILFLSVLGWIVYFFCLYTWKKRTGTIFSPYIIFLTFAFLFHYGQCLMWALGIHTNTEIGTSMLYHSTKAGLPSASLIIKGQLLSLMGLYSFHCGALVVVNRREKRINSINKGNINTPFYIKNDLLKNRVLYIVCLIVFLISTPATIFNEINTLIINKTYGYGSVLYGNVTSPGINIIALLSYMYFASIVGLLISTNFKKRIQFICYGSFFIYSVLCIFSGDRGEMLFPLVFLVWLHNYIYKPINKNNFFKIILGCFIILILFAALRSARTSAISFSSIINAILSDDNPITSSFFEMGNSFGVVLVLLNMGTLKYPFGNTYIIAFLGMITEKLIMLFEPNYISVSGWLSQNYLGINYGAGFSMVAEALANFGPYIGVAFLFFIGIIYSKIMNISIRQNDSVLSLFFKITTAEALFISARNALISSLKIWFFSTVIICLIVLLITNILKRKKFRF